MPTCKISRLQKFFFQAALATYAAGKKAERPPDRPWVKQLTHHGDGELSGLVYVDEYHTNGEWSGGSTVIASAEDLSHPIWLMQYCGWCKDDDPEVLAFLKQALLAAYTKGEWNGGRGPGEFAEDKENGLVYMNWPLMPPFDQSFRSFIGRERIWRQPDRTKDTFWHQYQGWLLGEPE